MSGKKVKLHLGCGKRYREGYTHVDLAKFKHIDVYSNVDDLNMFDDDSVSEIYASHVLEYFDEFQAINVLSEWRRVLGRDGTLFLSVPDFNALIEIYKSTNDIKKILGPLFGRMPLNDLTIYHKTVYSRKFLFEMLENIGFKECADWDTCIELPNFDDHSKAFFPHMDPTGIQVSLNIMCHK